MIISLYSLHRTNINIPLGIKLGDFYLELRFRCILLIPNLQSSYSRYQACLEGDIVFALRACVDIAHNNINGLSGIALVQIDIPYKIDVLEDLWRQEVGREYLFRRKRLGGIDFGGGGEGESRCTAQQIIETHDFVMCSSSGSRNSVNVVLLLGLADDEDEASDS